MASVMAKRFGLFLREEQDCIHAHVLCSTVSENQGETSLRVETASNVVESYFVGVRGDFVELDIRVLSKAEE